MKSVPLKNKRNARVVLVITTACTLWLTLACGLLCISVAHSKLWWVAYVAGLSLASILLAHHTTDESRFFAMYAMFAFLETFIWFRQVERLIMSTGDWILPGALLLIAVLSSLLYRQHHKPS